LSGAIPNLLYTPQPNFVGDDSFQFGASDVQGAATVARINITVQPTNTAPVAENLAFSTTQESAVALNLAASDADGDELIYGVVSTPTHGSLIGAGTDWVYTPNANFVGVETFTFTVNDGQADAQVATVTINVVAGPNEASVAGLVFEDRNGNGQPDEDEQGVGGLRVTLIPVNARAGVELATTTEAGGGWRIDGAAFGQYTLRIVSANGIGLATPVEKTITLSQRGIQQNQPMAVKVTRRSLFVPLIQR
jgi:hypothetical protein